MSSSRQRFPASIFAAFGIRIPFPERMALIREAGFDAVGLWWEERHPQGRSFREQTPRLAREAGLDVDTVHVPYAWADNLWSDDAEDRQQALELHLGWLRDLARHSVPVMVMHVCTAQRTPAAQGLEAAARIAEEARALGVVVGVENTRQPALVDAVLAAVDEPALGLCYDVSHDVLYAPQPYALLERWRSRLVACHLGDTDGKLDRHWLPGAGVVDFAAMARRFPVDYAGSLALEVSSKRPLAEAAEFLAEARASLRAIERAVPTPDARDADSGTFTDA
jgi:sugar phosphate isomerase/epimerase